MDSVTAAILEAAQVLLRQVHTPPGGEQRIQSIMGNYNAQVYESGLASVNVNHSKES